MFECVCVCVCVCAPSPSISQSDITNSCLVFIDLMERLAQPNAHAREMARLAFLFSSFSLFEILIFRDVVVRFQ